MIPFVKAKENNNTLSPNAKSAILLKESIGEIIYEYKFHKKYPPASMTKFMTT